MRTANLKKLLVAFFFLSFIVCPAVGKRIYVNDDATGANNGNSWTDAYTSLQSALGVATFGDAIWVAAGTYKPTTTTDRTASFQMKKGVGIYGGFAGNEDPNSFDLADRDFTTNESILSGDIGEVGNNWDNCYHVVYNQQGTNLDSSAVLDGFTITGGNANGGTYWWGGGLFNLSCSPTVTNCSFYGNAATMGGGMSNHYYSSPTVTNCTFYDNSVTSPGGGLSNSVYSSPTVTNCTFYGNTAGMHGGGGIWNEVYSSPIVTNCILWANSPDSIDNYSFNSSPVVTYSDVQAGTGQIWFGEGCIDEDPCLFDATGGDFHLLGDSPCINAGINSAPDLPLMDFEGDDRILYGTVDMGADEWIIQFTLIVIAEPEEGGIVTLDPAGGIYGEETVVTLTANPTAGYGFDHWSGDLTGSTNPDTIVMDANKTVTAHFVAEYTLAVTADPFSGGTVTLNPPGGVYLAGTIVELDAEAAPGYRFDYWSGDLTGSTEPNTIVMDSSKNVTAHFTFKGSGSETDPYQIGTAGQLHLLSQDSTFWGSNSYFVLTDDIVIPPGFIVNPIGNNSITFDGNFDGAGHTISGLIQSGSFNLGLFGKTGSSAKLRNLGVVAATINGTINGPASGILVGYNYYGTISDCSASGAVNGGYDSWYLGGLVGYNYGGTISDCSASGAVNGGRNSEYLGGLVGRTIGGTISNCYATGSVTGGDYSYGLGGLLGKNNGGTISNCYATGVVNGRSYSGGLVGYNYNGNISNCYATGSVTGGDYSRYLGGMVGYNDGGTISNCYATGEVNGGPYAERLGGLMGYNYYGSISNCYATGSVTGGDYSQKLGGLVGENNGGIGNCYATGAVTGTSYLGGLVGWNQGVTISHCYWDINTSYMTDGVGNQDPDPAGVMGKTTVEMKQQATFVGWDFTDTWLIMEENQSYPYQHITAGPTPPIHGDNNGDGKVDFRDIAIVAGNWLAGTEP